MSKKKGKSPRSWIVKVKCTVIKELVCEDCLEDQALSEPWDHSIDETEIDQIDWDVLTVTPNV